MRRIIRRIISGFVIAGLKFYTFVTKRPRVRVVVLDESERVLLIRQYISNGNNWTLPGGGLERKESAVDAAIRELHEETGILLSEADFTYLGTLQKPHHNIPFTAPIYLAKITSHQLPQSLYNPREIIEIGWFDQQDLPKNISQTVVSALHFYTSQGK